MPEKLDSLIERIRTEGLEKADRESAEQIDAAKKKAAAIVEAAERKAEDIVAEAEKQARLFDERGQQSLSQAARDTVLTVSKAIEATFEELTRLAVRQALDHKTLGDLIVAVVKRYFDDSGSRGDISVLVSSDDAAFIEKHLMAAFGKASEKGLEIGKDSELVGGFRVSVKDDHLFHDLSDEAISRMLCAFLRPQLAEITRRTLEKARTEDKT